MKRNCDLGLVLGSSLLITAPLALCSSPPQESAVETVVIDAKIQHPPPNPLPFAAGGESPNGHILAVNSQYLVRDGKPWFPVMGEFHYSRYPEANWEEEIPRMKAAGIQIISTYVFWIHHEEVEGNLTGRANVTCATL